MCSHMSICGNWATNSYKQLTNKQFSFLIWMGLHGVIVRLFWYMCMCISLKTWCEWGPLSNVYTTCIIDKQCTQYILNLMLDWCNKCESCHMWQLWECVGSLLTLLLIAISHTCHLQKGWDSWLSLLASIFINFYVSNPPLNCKFMMYVSFSSFQAFCPLKL